MRAFAAVFVVLGLIAGCGKADQASTESSATKSPAYADSNAEAKLLGTWSATTKGGRDATVVFNDDTTFSMTSEESEKGSVTYSGNYQLEGKDVLVLTYTAIEPKGMSNAEASAARKSLGEMMNQAVKTRLEWVDDGQITFTDWDGTVFSWKKK